MTMNTGKGHPVRTLWLCGTLHAFTHIYHVALMPLYLLIQRDLKLASVEAATLLLTLMMLAYFLPSYGMGVLADRLSRKKLLAAGLAINALGYVALAFAPNYAWAVVCVLISGLGGSFFHPAATSMVWEAFPTLSAKSTRAACCTCNSRCVIAVSNPGAVTFTWYFPGVRFGKL